MTAKDKTVEVIERMLKENTGRALCDSGDYYGRNYERNQKIDLSAERATTLSFCVRSSGLDINLTHNVYHWLCDRLSYVEDEERIFDLLMRYADMKTGEETTYLSLLEEFPLFFALYRARQEKIDCASCNGHGAYDDDTSCDECRGTGRTRRELTYNFTAKSGFTAQGDFDRPTCIWDSSDEHVSATNTYNDANGFLSQGLLFVCFELNYTEYCFLSVHGGCDARGGYTRPRLFEVTQEQGMYEFGRGTIYCSGYSRDGCTNSWHSDDAYMFYPNDQEKDLSSYKVLKLVACKDKYEEGEAKQWVKGALCVAEEDLAVNQAEVPGFVAKGTGLCPDCGSELKGGF